MKKVLYIICNCNYFFCRQKFNIKKSNNKIFYTVLSYLTIYAHSHIFIHLLFSFRSICWVTPKIMARMLLTLLFHFHSKRPRIAPVDISWVEDEHHQGVGPDSICWFGLAHQTTINDKTKESWVKNLFAIASITTIYFADLI